MVKILRVTDKKSLNKFIDFPYNHYKNDHNYVPDLRIMVKEVLNKKKNPFFKHGDAQYFLALDENGKTAGRIAAITNQMYVNHWNENWGFFGFFEAIEDKEVTKALFDAAIEWLKEKGVEGMYGPMNPSTNDPCGTLVEGFKTPPFVMMTHNKEYYDRLFMEYGLEKKMDLFAWYLKHDKIPERMLNLSKRIEERLKTQGITIREIDFSKLDEEAPKLRYIYNEAWKDNWGFVPFTDEEFDALVKELKMITSPDLVFVVEDHGEPVAFSATIPNINEIFIKIRNGKLFPFNFLKLLNFKKRIKTVRILTLGILENYRKTGIDAVMYAKTFENGTKKGYHEGEASWILESNVMMNRALKNINAELYKTYRIYQHKF
jgi:hypothetical protein